MSEAATEFEGWAVLELMGHRKLAGYVQPATIAGAGVLRIDVPGEGDEGLVTQFYAPSALYCLTPVTEDMARRVARTYAPAPVTRWELPPAIEPGARREPELPLGEPWDDEDGPSTGDVR